MFLELQLLLLILIFTSTTLDITHHPTGRVVSVTPTGRLVGMHSVRLDPSGGVVVVVDDLVFGSVVHSSVVDLLMNSCVCGGIFHTQCLIY